MKTIETGISEQRFLSRIDNLCRKKTRFDDGYKSLEVFVVKQKENRFWLAKHYPAAPKSQEYTGNCLYCKYFKNQDGHIVVNYSFGQRIGYLLFKIIILLASLFLSVSIICDIVAGAKIETGEILFAVAIILITVFLNLRNLKKEYCELEEHLLKICNIKE